MDGGILGRWSSGDVAAAEEMKEAVGLEGTRRREWNHRDIFSATEAFASAINLLYLFPWSISFDFIPRVDNSLAKPLIFEIFILLLFYYGVHV